MNKSYNLNRINFLSNLLLRICLVAIIAMPLLWVYGWVLLVIDGGQLLKTNFNIRVGTNSLSWVQWLAALAVSSISLLFTLAAIWSLRKLMLCYINVQYFSSVAIQYLNRFSYWLFLSFIAKLIQPIFMSLILTATNPPGEKSLVIQLNNETLTTLFMAAVFYLITQIMKEGRNLAEENAEII